MIKWGRKLKLVLFCPLLVFLFLVVSRKYFESGLLMSRQAYLMAGVKKWYNYTKDDLNGPLVSMSDGRLVMKLRNDFLVAPPDYSPDHSYVLNEPDLDDTSMGQAKKIRTILNNRRNGFFIECGALDGETRSNTLYFERYLNWTGLLIEADPLNFAELLKKNRRAWLSPTCLSVKPYPEIVSFEQNSNMGKISDVNSAGVRLAGHTDVQCFPLFTYLLALNITHVDYFSLDIEGAELDALQTIPFDKVNIETLSVEFVHVAKGQDALKDFMIGKGYKVHSKVTHPNWLANDFIFMKA